MLHHNELLALLTSLCWDVNSEYFGALRPQEWEEKRQLAIWLLIVDSDQTLHAT